VRVLLAHVLEPAAVTATETAGDAVSSWCETRAEAAAAAAAGSLRVFAAALAHDATQVAAIRLTQAAPRLDRAACCAPHTALCAAMDALDAFAGILEASPATRCAAEVAMVVRSAASLTASMRTIAGVWAVTGGAEAAAHAKCATSARVACRSAHALLRAQPTLVTAHRAAAVARIALRVLQPEPGDVAAACACRRGMRRVTGGRLRAAGAAGGRMRWRRGAAAHPGGSRKQ
jgi:hypothetical protein